MKVVGGNTLVYSEWKEVTWKEMSPVMRRVKCAIEKKTKQNRGERERREKDINQKKVKKSHHVSTEPHLYVIHDTGLRNGDLWSKAMDKPRGSTEATQINNCNAQTKQNKRTGIAVTRGRERKMVQMKTNKNENKKKICSKDTLSPSQVCALTVSPCATVCMSSMSSAVPRLCIVLISSKALTWLNSCRLMSHSSVNYSTSLVN